MGRTKQTGEKGFTIVELLIVIVVIGILAAVSFLAYNGIQLRAAGATLQSDLQGAATQLEVYKTDHNDRYPDDADDLKHSNSTTFQYTTNGTTYCLSATTSRYTDLQYNISSATTTVQEGLCDGHVANPGVALECPDGFIPVPGNSTFGTSDFCVMKYEAKNVGGVATSQASGYPWSPNLRSDAISASTAACSGCHIITEAEWMTIAANVLSVASNWSGNAVGSGSMYRGHSDSSPTSPLPADASDANGYSGTGQSSGNQRRTLTLTNGEVIWDFAGNTSEWTSATIGPNEQPGYVDEAYDPYDAFYDWKNWNDGALSMHSLPSVSQPSTISAQIADWDAFTNGIGMLRSNYNDNDATHGYARGGNWGDNLGAGVLALDLSQYDSYSYVGFRVAK